MSFSPLQLQFMLAYSSGSAPEQFFTEQTWHSEAAKEIRRWMVLEGLVNEDYQASERLLVHIKMLCEVRLPVQIWVSPDGSE